MLGTTGATAYFGLLDAASAKEGDIVFVSAAAGAVGSAVVQIAKAKGMTVIGSAGGEEKCDFVRSLGADQVVDYRAGPILKGLAAAAPEGIDVYFDNVGGDHLDAALAVARNNARFAICGMIEGYNTDRAHQPSLHHAHHRRAHPAQGFLVFDYQPRMDEFYRDMGGWLKSGAVTAKETMVEGLENMPDAFWGCSAARTPGRCWSGSRVNLHAAGSPAWNRSAARASAAPRCRG